MSKILHHIRKQPVHVRTRYMYGVVIACTAIIILLWIIGLGYRFSKVSVQDSINYQKDVLNTLSENNQQSTAKQNQEADLPVEVIQ